MVVALGPGKFYGRSLPRPRMMVMNRSESEEEEDIYKKKSRVDPPLGVMDPLLNWAHEAHWSMGGLSFIRLKLQGKIEGNVKKLKSQQKKKLLAIKNKSPDDSNKTSVSSSASPSPPPAPAPAATKRPVVEEDHEEVVSEINYRRKPKRARKLVDDFDRVASSESTIQSSSSSPKSPNTVSSRPRGARKISSEKVAAEEEEEITTPAAITTAEKVQNLSKPTRSKANEVVNVASKKNKSKSVVTPAPPTSVRRTSARLESSPTF